MTTLFDSTFARGTVITGEWNKRSYEVVSRLGEGANGKVLLVRRGKGNYAMKVGFDVLELQSEINVLKTLEPYRDRRDPYLLDVDDFRNPQGNFTFYVMKYVKGHSLQAYIAKNGKDWLFLIMYHALTKLANLHGRGFVFGDLKTENMVVGEYGKVELVDYGGVTSKGRAVKQFTEVFDRGFWNAGSRIAEESYDLFSLSLVLLQAADPEGRIASAQRLLPQHRNPAYLMDIARSLPQIQPMMPFLNKAIHGKYATSAAAVRDLRRMMLEGGYSHHAPHAPRWIKGFFIASVLIFLLTLYMNWQ